MTRKVRNVTVWKLQSTIQLILSISLTTIINSSGNVTKAGMVVKLQSAFETEAAT